MVLKRILAYIIDWFVIILYAGILFLVTYSLYQMNGAELEVLDPVKGNFISFFSLTLPVFLYFYFFEKSSKQGTLGKQLMKIKIENNSSKNVFVRVFMKILPWEIAHFGMHYAVYYEAHEMEIPVWNMVVNLVPQIIVLVYFISVLLSNGKSSVYDKVAQTGIAKV